MRDRQNKDKIMQSPLAIRCRSCTKLRRLPSEDWSALIARQPHDPAGLSLRNSTQQPMKLGRRTGGGLEVMRRGRRKREDRIANGCCFAPLQLECCHCASLVCSARQRIPAIKGSSNFNLRNQASIMEGYEDREGGTVASDSYLEICTLQCCIGVTEKGRSTIHSDLIWFDGS